MKFPNTPLWSAFSSRKDLLQFGSNSLILFALQLKFPIEDIFSVAATALLDGANDKKIDLVYIDTEAEVAVIGQSYFSSTFSKKEAKANKASDLNTAVSWLLASSIDTLPEPLRSPAEELRRAIKDGTISRICIWYVHNLIESKNVASELRTVEHTMNAILKSNYKLNEVIEIQAIEVGQNILNEWYKAISTPILVPDIFEIEIPGGFEIKDNDWHAYVTSIPGKWLYEQYRKYGTKLFSADVREYLGSRRSDKNINDGIKKTAIEDPSRFWPFNNGITILVNDFISNDNKDKKSLRITGASIVNGAQTTGALGHLEKDPSSNIMVQVRFIKCTNPKTVKDIVKYNNSQNKINAPDFRSNDPIQTRLITEFKLIPNTEYAPRRGSNQDIILRRPNILSSVIAGQALAAFHRNPDIAYHKKTFMWESDALYTKYFNEQTTARHIIFSFALLKAIETKKFYLLEKSRSGSITKIEAAQLTFYRKRGSIFMMQAAIANCIEIFLNKPTPNIFKIRFKGNISPDQGAKLWEPIVNIASSFTQPLFNGLSDGFKNDKAVQSAIDMFRSLINSIKDANSTIFSTFANKIEVA